MRIGADVSSLSEFTPYSSRFGQRIMPLCPPWLHTTIPAVQQSKQTHARNRRCLCRNQTHLKGIPVTGYVKDASDNPHPIPILVTNRITTRIKKGIPTGAHIENHPDRRKTIRKRSIPCRKGSAASNCELMLRGPLQPVQNEDREVR